MHHLHKLSKKLPFLLAAITICLVLPPINSYAKSKEKHLYQFLKHAEAGSIDYNKSKSIVKTLVRLNPSKGFEYTKEGIRAFVRTEEDQFQAIGLCRQAIKIIQRSNISNRLIGKNVLALRSEINMLQPGFLF